MEISPLAGAHRRLRDGGVLTLYSLFIAGFFLLPMAAGHRRLYYFLVFPATLLLAREFYKLYRGNPLALLIIAYAGWMMLSITWTNDYTADAALSQAWTTLNLLSFVAVTGYIWVSYPARVTRYLPRLVWLAAAAALVSSVAWYSSNPFPDSRLVPLGVMHHQNKSGAAYGLFLVLCVHFWLNSGQRRERLVYLGLAAILAALVLLTQSRTALAGVCTSLLILLGWRGAVVVALAGAVSWILLAMNPGDWWHRVEALSFRPLIWQQVLADMRQHWLLGHGVLSDPRILTEGQAFDHAHNGYLASLRDGGVIGLGLLLTLFTTALWQALTLLREQGERIYLALLLYGMACIFMDFDRLLVHPKEMWLYLWAPVAVIMASFARRDDPGLLRTSVGRPA